MPEKPSKAPRRKVNYRRCEEEGWEYKDSYSGQFRVYDDGRLGLKTSSMETEIDRINSDYSAVQDFKSKMLSYILDQEKDIQSRLKIFWSKAEGNFNKLIPVDNPDDFKIHIDCRTHILTRVKIAVEEPETPGEQS